MQPKIYLNLFVYRRRRLYSKLINYNNLFTYNRHFYKNKSTARRIKDAH